MQYKKEIKPTLEYKNVDGTHICNEGDDVSCTVRDGRRYIGRISAIGRYQENEETEPENAICIHMPKGKTSYHGEIIKVADIAQICRNPAIDSYEYLKADKEQDRSNFISMIVGLGYSEEKAKIAYESIRDILDIYNIPLSCALGDAIRLANLSVDGTSQEELIEITNKLLDIVVNLLDAINKSVRERVKECIASQDGKQ